MQRFLRSVRLHLKDVSWISPTWRSPPCPGSWWPAWRSAAPSSEGPRNDLDACARCRGFGGPPGLPRRGAAATGEVLVTQHAWLLLAAYCTVLLVLAVPTGRTIAHVMEGRLAFAGRVESVFYRLAGVKADAEMGWLQYALAILVFNGLGVLVVYLLQRVQRW